MGGKHVHLCTRGNDAGDGGCTMLVLSGNILTDLRAPWLLGVGSAITHQWLLRLTCNCPCSCSLFAYSELNFCLSGSEESRRWGPASGRETPLRSRPHPLLFTSFLQSDHPSAFLPCICSLCRSALLLSPLLRFPCYVKTAQELALCLGEWMAIQGYGDR